VSFTPQNFGHPLYAFIFSEILPAMFSFRSLESLLILNLEVKYSSETSVDFQQTTRRHVPED
jgi:hypothetical protein